MKIITRKNILNACINFNRHLKGVFAVFFQNLSKSILIWMISITNHCKIPNCFAYFCSFTFILFLQCVSMCASGGLLVSERVSIIQYHWRLSSYCDVSCFDYIVTLRNNTYRFTSQPWVKENGRFSPRAASFRTAEPVHATTSLQKWTHLRTEG